MSLQELSRAVEDRTLWTSLIHSQGHQESELTQWHETLGQNLSFAERQNN